jgi:hypothetical protein
MSSTAQHTARCEPCLAEISDLAPADLGLLSGELPAPSARIAPADALKARIAELIRAYVAERSPHIARAIARLSAALALHPSLRHAPEECNALCRLNRHWRLLAAQCPAPAAS